MNKRCKENKCRKVVVANGKCKNHICRCNTHSRMSKDSYFNGCMIHEG